MPTNAPQIVDQWGRPIRTSDIREPQTESASNEPMVASLRREFAHHPAKGLTPERINAILREDEEGNITRLIDLADDMEERDGQIFSELAKRRAAVVGLRLEILEPPNADAAEKKITDQVREWVLAIPNFKQTVIANMMSGVLKAFSNIEMWFELEEGFLQPRLAARPQRWFTMSEDRERITLRTTASAYGEELRPGNWIQHRHPALNGYLVRSSMARVLTLPYLYKNYATRDFAEFLEIYGLPLRLGKYPTGASDDEKRRLLEAVVGIGHNAAGIVPLGMEIDFQNAASGVDVPFVAMCERMDAIQSKIIIGQTLTSGEGKHGTQALGAVHNEIRLDILQADADLCSETLTAQLIAPMVLLNFAGVNPKRLPRAHLVVPEPRDFMALATAAPNLARAGMRISIDWLHEQTGIPRAEDGAEIVQAAPDPLAPGDGGTPGGNDPAGDPAADPARAPGTKLKPQPPRKAPPKRTALSATGGGDGGGDAGGPARDPLDDLVDEAAAEWRQALSPMVSPLLEALSAAKERGMTLEQFGAQLPDLLDKMDHTPMAERLARSCFSARLAGEADLDLGS